MCPHLFRLAVWCCHFLTLVSFHIQRHLHRFHGLTAVFQKQRTIQQAEKQLTVEKITKEIYSLD